jgi:hypothetical protein
MLRLRVLLLKFQSWRAAARHTEYGENLKYVLNRCRRGFWLNFLFVYVLMIFLCSDDFFNVLMIEHYIRER